MHRKIFKAGNSLVVALSKNILGKAGLRVGDSVEVEIKDENVIIKKSTKGKQLGLEFKIRRKF